MNEKSSYKLRSRPARKKAWDSNVGASLELTRLSPKQAQQKAEIRAKYNAAIYESSPRNPNSPLSRRHITRKSADALKTPASERQAADVFITPSPPHFSARDTMITPSEILEDDLNNRIMATPTPETEETVFTENVTAKDGALTSSKRGVFGKNGGNSSPHESLDGFDSEIETGDAKDKLKQVVDFNSELKSFKQLAKETRTVLKLPEFVTPEPSERKHGIKSKTDSNLHHLNAQSQLFHKQLKQLEFLPEYLIQDFENLSVCCDNLSSFLTVARASDSKSAAVGSPAISRIVPASPSNASGQITPAERLHNACSGTESVLFLLADNLSKMRAEMAALKRDHEQTTQQLKHQTSHTQQLERVVENQAESISDLLKLLKKQELDHKATNERLNLAVEANRLTLARLKAEADKGFAKWAVWESKENNLQ